MSSYGIFGVGLFVGVFFGFFIVGLLDSLREFGEVRQAARDEVRERDSEHVDVSFDCEIDDFEPVVKVDRVLVCLDGGKGKGERSERGQSEQG